MVWPTSFRDQDGYTVPMAHLNKTRITIRIDTDLLERFKADAERTQYLEHPVGYQQLICEVLREGPDTRDYLASITPQSAEHLRWCAAHDAKVAELKRSQQAH
jgi:hypothetical protein